jgi:hypothetical protein
MTTVPNDTFGSRMHQPLPPPAHKRAYPRPLSLNFPRAGGDLRSLKRQFPGFRDEMLAEALMALLVHAPESRQRIEVARSIEVALCP